MSQLAIRRARAPFDRPTPTTLESVPFDEDAREQTRWKGIVAVSFAVAVICLGLALVTQIPWFILPVLIFWPWAMVIILIDILLRLDDNKPLTMEEVTA